MKKFTRVLGVTALMLAFGAGAATAQQLPLNNAVQTAAWGIAGSVDRGTRVVVLAVESSAFAMSDYIIGETTVALIGLQAVQGFTVVPRSEVNMAIGGLPISTSGFVSNAMAHSVGGLLNAQFVVIGAFESIAGTFRLRLQLIEVATANVRVVQTIDVVNDAMVAYFMGGAATAWAPASARAPRPPLGPMPDNWFSWGWYGGGTNLRYERRTSDTLALGVNVFYSGTDFFAYRSGMAFGLTGTARLFPGGGRFFFLELGLGLGIMDVWRREERSVPTAWGSTSMWYWERHENVGGDDSPRHWVQTWWQKAVGRLGMELALEHNCGRSRTNWYRGHFSPLPPRRCAGRCMVGGFSQPAGTRSGRLGAVAQALTSRPRRVCGGYVKEEFVYEEDC